MPSVGQLNGKIDCLINTGSSVNNGQNVYKCLWDFLISHPRMAEIASHRGSGGSPGIGYHDEATPFGTNAWSVFKWTSSGNSLRNGTGGYDNYERYVMIQWADAANFGGTGTPGCPGCVDGHGSAGSGALNGDTNDHQVGIAVAIAPNSTSLATISNNPLNTVTGTFQQNATAGGVGASATPSAQIKNQLVWTNPGPGTDLFIFPRNNSGNPGGSGTSGDGSYFGPTTPARQNMTAAWSLIYSQTFETRLSIVADDDNMCIMSSINNDTYYMWYHGLYTPKVGLSVPWPEINIGTYASSNGLPITSGVDLGSRVGLDPPSNGGVVMQTGFAGSGVRNMQIDRLKYLMDSPISNLHPNKLPASPTYDEFPVFVYASELTKYYGYLGQVDWFRELYNVNTYDTDASKNRAFFGGSSLASIKVSIPWCGNQPSSPTANVVTPWGTGTDPATMSGTLGTVDVGLAVPIGGQTPGTGVTRGGYTFRRTAGTW